MGPASEPKQREVILFMHMSLDGYVGRPDEGRMEWTTPDTTKEIGLDLIPDLLKTVDTMLLGRNLYQGFEQAWPMMAKDPNMPREIVDFARWVIDSKKIVFSSKLDKVGWKNSELVRVKSDEEVADAVRRLKRQPGGDMVVFGGGTFAKTLVREGLVDEYRFKLEPTILGSGFRLFEGADATKLELVREKRFPGGVLGLYYRPK